MTKQLQRYDFGSLRDFRKPIQFSDAALPVEEEATPPPPPPPTFGEAEMQSARIEAKKLGYNEGFLAGQAQAAAVADAAQQDANQAIGALSEQIATLSNSYTELLKQESLNVSELALLIAKKVAGEALRERDVDVISALVVRCLPVIFSRPRLNIELHPDTLPKAQQRLQDYMVAQGYEGDLQFRANATLGVHDARLDWGKGVAERSTEALWQDISRLLERVPLELEIPNTTTDATGA